MQYFAYLFKLIDLLTHQCYLYLTFPFPQDMIKYFPFKIFVYCLYGCWTFLWYLLNYLLIYEISIIPPFCSICFATLKTTQKLFIQVLLCNFSPPKTTKDEGIYMA